MIYLATPDDAETIAAMEMEIFPDSCFNETTIRHELEIGQGWLAGRPALGYVLVRVEGTLADITRLGVRPECQGGGTGSALLRQALSVCSTAMLTVRKHNKRAIQLYQRYGFRIVGSFESGSWIMIRGKKF
jgi:ribosomal protein S18 acetylase RimI-like enzyme